MVVSYASPLSSHPTDDLANSHSHLYTPVPHPQTHKSSPRTAMLHTSPSPSFFVIILFPHSQASITDSHTDITTSPPIRSPPASTASSQNSASSSITTLTTTPQRHKNLSVTCLDAGPAQKQVLPYTLRETVL
ncbi:uncharacterized protein M421DRAFT_187531 [Didymella exigua CBS 183.55]|uniref:Uncharacterized protein n=1 Tax=Didymella exigua CBS 183.55 TaxID=1150837 RepID=A0A6A5RIN7_9PLEO|nr:uncharacterized protein M421DRAFT_187531 [Didymella exigua CBS 183.55]KAF1926958.1 hypothetical protein M421DRAFT_187531 [Didymella exigua CBS 183.55]